jgi:ATP-binding cassette subfamily E protein 1
LFMARIAVIEKDKCHPRECGDYLCIRVCPINKGGQECIIKGEDKKAAINTELCVGCGICPKRCPFGAIHIINLPEELEKQPIHQYGENGFHLYSLPTPIFGKVVGILGVNGIGKSTAVKILAGVLKPNLAKKEGYASFEELIEYFKGTEAQLFFEKVRDGEIKVAYKPQSVDMIPKKFKGKVIDLLKQADEKNTLQQVAEQLELTEFLDHNITDISGGELQRVAIAATVLKKANVYFFDEPTSYLDIKQRIKVSKFIRSLADDETAVMVVEHDLIILDYMTELLHIMYGKGACYGIVSLPKSTRAGINVYLEGYLREENMMFREKPIKFMAKPPTMTRAANVLTSWQGIKKKLGVFELESEQGELMKNEVSGVLGENGIGKTSFVKILAGVQKQDAGEIKQEVKVSYKPQYLSTESDELVMNVLKNAIKNYEVQLIRPLGLKPLFTKKINELSGGELQKVAVAECLSKDAELYLLDEPSAYLDVEQRLIVSKIIREIVQQKGISALVVDHDLLFVDYLSDRLMVFEGVPAKKGIAKGPFGMERGMNLFLKDLGMTLRRDPESNRPRVNKPGSQKDRQQKKEGKLYYV